MATFPCMAVHDAIHAAIYFFLADQVEVDRIVTCLDLGGQVVARL